MIEICFHSIQNYDSGSFLHGADMKKIVYTLILNHCKFAIIAIIDKTVTCVGTIRIFEFIKINAG